MYAELTDMPWMIVLPTCDGISENFGVTLHSFSQMYDCTTVIRFVVNVPVLSEQMAVALPIVSQASKCRTKLLSFIIFCKKKLKNKREREIEHDTIYACFMKCFFLVKIL